MASPPPPTRLDALTPLRGIAALWVVIFHFQCCYDDYQFGILLSRSASGLLSRGYLWVDFFFLLSGFILSHVYGNAFANRPSLRECGRFLAARFARMYPLHLFTMLLVAIPIRAWIAHAVGSELIDDPFVDWRTFPLSLFLLHSFGLTKVMIWNFVSWSISAEWWTYVVAAVPLIWLNRGSRYRAACGIALTSVSLFAVSRWLGSGTIDVTVNGGVLRCIAEFTAGVGIYRLLQSPRTPSSFGNGLWCVSAIGAVLLTLHFPISDLWVVAAFAYLLATFARAQGISLRIMRFRPFQWLGEISFSIYLMQGPILDYLFPGMEALAKTWSPIGPVEKGVVLAGTIALIVGAADLAHRFVEVPAQRWIRDRLAPPDDFRKASVAEPARRAA